MPEYEIRKGVPIMASGRQVGLTKTIRKMEFMDSIVVPKSQLSSTHACAAQAGAKVKTQKNADGTVTVWRIDQSVKTAAEAGARATDAIAALEATPTSKSILSAPAPAPDRNSLGGYYRESDPYGSSVFVVTEVDEFGRPVVPGYTPPPISGSVPTSKPSPSPSPSLSSAFALAPEPDIFS